MASVLRRLRRISNQWRKNQEDRNKPKSPSSIADFPASIEFLAGDENDTPLVDQEDKPLADESEQSDEAPLFLPNISPADCVSPSFAAQEGQDEAVLSSSRKDLEVLQHEVSPRLQNQAKEDPPALLQHAQQQDALRNVVEEDNTQVQQFVSIVAGNNKGKRGEIVGIFDKRTYYIRLLSSRKVERVRMKSVVHDNAVDNDGEMFQTETTASNVVKSPRILHYDVSPGQNQVNMDPSALLHHHDEQQQEPQLEVVGENHKENRRIVSIVAGSNKGERGEIVGTVDKRTYHIRLLSSGKVERVRMKSVLHDHDVVDGDNLLQTKPTASTSSRTPQILALRDENRQHRKSSSWLGLRVRDRVTESIGMVESAVDDKSVFLRLDDRDQLLRVPTSQLSPSIARKILPQSMLLEDQNQKRVKISLGKKDKIMASTMADGNRRNQEQVEITSTGESMDVRRSSIVDTDNLPFSLQANRSPLVSAANARANAEVLISPTNDREHAIPTETLVNRQVLICRGGNRGKLALVLGDGPRKNLVQVNIDGKVVNVQRASIEFDVTKPVSQKVKRRIIGQTSRSVQRQAPAWALPNTMGSNILRFGGKRTMRIRIDDKPTLEITMLNHLFGDRLIHVEVVLNGRCNQTALEATVHHEGVKFELVSTKLTEDEHGGRFCKKKVLVCGYVATEGPNLPSLSLYDELLRIADFSRLPSRKIASRLELFLSPARLPIYFAEEEDFCQIPETGNVGCGFISEEKLLDICLNGKMGKTAASLVSSIQVRIFCPRIGILKGMLTKKQNTKAPIEYPPSMLKVPAASSENAWDSAAIVVCKNGVHPSPASANEYIGRALDDSRKKPPKKSFEQKIQKELKEMIARLWLSMGVPRHISQNYMKDSVKADRRNHAWLVGVADPTGCLPADSVFVPGFKNRHPDQLFVTRSPCVKYDDGRILEQIRTQPESMSDDDWAWLNRIYFGCIIFSNPRQDMMSMPERIAEGDLDGDLYLVCWDEEILSCMNAAPLPAIPEKDSGELSTIPSDRDWLQKAQAMLLDVGGLNNLGKLTGKLYTLGEKIADASEEGLRDADATAFFDAYNQALEYKKHGRPIVLPSHLQSKVPKELRSLLVDSV